VDRRIMGSDAFIQTNLEGAFSIREAVRQAWAGLQGYRSLNISTDEVYSSQDEEDKSQGEMAYAPISTYSTSKAGSNHLVRAYLCTWGIDVVTTNCSNHYGSRQHSEKLTPLVITSIAKGEPIPIYNDGLDIRDWLLLKDHCAVLETGMINGVMSESYCMGGDNEKTNLVLVDALRNLHLGRPQGTSRKLKTFVQDRAGHDRRYAIDTSKIQKMIGWSP